MVRRGTQAFPGAAFLHLYGATETAPIVSGLPDEVDALQRIGAEIARKFAGAGAHVVCADVLSTDEIVTEQVMRGWRSSQARTAGVVWVETSSSTTCSSPSG